MQQSLAQLHITPELIERVDRFGLRFNTARMEALMALLGNPYGVEIQFFGAGDAAAFKVRHPLLRGKNRIYGFQAGDLSLLNDLLAFYQTDALPCTLYVPHGQMSRELFSGLVQAGMWSKGSGFAPVIDAQSRAEQRTSSASLEINVRVSGPEEKELYLDLFQQSFTSWPEQEPGYRAFQWAEDSLPRGQRYIAEIDGVPVAMASFPIVDGIGYFGACGVLPDYRRQGVQAALIRRRIADATALGCDLVLGSSSPPIAFRNFERAGLRLVPTSSAWSAID